MNTPPPHPPSQSFYSPYSSTYSLHTPGSECSFDRFSSAGGSSLYSEPIFRTKSVQPKIETREPEPVTKESVVDRPSLSRSKTAPLTSTMASTTNRDYLYFSYRKDGEKWDGDITIEEIPASQAQIKKLAEKKNKAGTAIQQLQKMGANRRAQIDLHKATMNAEEVDGCIWEPVWIANTKTKERNSVMEVKAFEVIFARKDPPRVRTFSTTFPYQPTRATAENSKAETKGDKSHKEKKKTKDKKPAPVANPSGLVDDPFGDTHWIDPSGAALGGSGSVGGPSLPPFIPPEKPIGTFNVQPNIVQVEPDPWGMPVFGAGGLGAGGLGMDSGKKGPGGPAPAKGLDLDEILKNLPDLPGMHEENDDDDILVVDDEHTGVTYPSSKGTRRRATGERGRRQSNQSRSRSRSRPRRFSNRANVVHFPDDHGMVDDYSYDEKTYASSMSGRRPSWRERGGKSGLQQKIYRQREDGRTRNVRFSDQFEHAIDSSSSVTSGDIGIAFDEVEELSSHTSEETSGTSSGQKIYRIITPTYRQHRPGPASPGSPRRYELASDEKVVMPARSRRRASRAIEQAQPQDPYGVEQPLVRRNTSPKQRPIINQAALPAIAPEVPPFAEFPDYYNHGGRQQREREEERHIDNYIRDTTRERSLREREEEIRRREQALASGTYRRADQDQRQRDVFELRDQFENLKVGDNFRKSVYTHDPRDNYRR